MGDEAASFDGKNEVRWRLLLPSFESLFSWKAVKAVVNFNCFKKATVVVKPTVCSNLGWVKQFFPVFIAPS
jgi:hypothetical protein